MTSSTCRSKANAHVGSGQHHHGRTWQGQSRWTVRESLPCASWAGLRSQRFVHTRHSEKTKPVHPVIGEPM
eukprot:12888142-Prorocentrum_lima.AAC.1